MRWALIASLAALVGGCAASKRPNPFAVDYSPELDATVRVPLGWTLQRSDDTGQYIQRVWVSPTGRTSYGVIRFNLPLPVGNDIALNGFIGQMRQDEGDAQLLSKHRDTAQDRQDQPDRLIFAAEGGRYRLDGIITTRGFHGWVVYAGILRNGPQALDELELAVQARENTRLGSSPGPLGDARRE